MLNTQYGGALLYLIHIAWWLLCLISQTRLWHNVYVAQIPGPGLSTSERLTASFLIAWTLELGSTWGTFPGKVSFYVSLLTNFVKNNNEDWKVTFNLSVMSYPLKEFDNEKGLMISSHQIFLQVLTLKMISDSGKLSPGDSDEQPSIGFRGQPSQRLLCKFEQVTLLSEIVRSSLNSRGWTTIHIHKNWWVRDLSEILLKTMNLLPWKSTNTTINRIPRRVRGS